MSKKTTPVLSAENILQAQDLRIRSAHVPEWGGHVLLRELDVAGRQIFSGAIAEGKDGLDLTVIVVALSLVGEDGALLLSEEDWPRLREKNPQILEKLARLTLEISGLAEEKKP